MKIDDIKASQSKKATLEFNQREIKEKAKETQEQKIEKNKDNQKTEITRGKENIELSNER